MKRLGIYVHIPFCVKKCDYCDFLSFENIGVEVHKQYIKALNNEIEYYGKVYGNDFIVDTIFFGGGTPTLIESNLIKEVQDCIKNSFSVDAEAEISIECNPKTVNGEKLEAYRDAGINRLSIGVQTLSDMMLKSLGRVHKSGEAVETYNLAREKGFENINLDLMFAIPGHTLEVWEDTLKQAVNLNPDHISFYSLQLEEGTKFFEMFEKGNLSMISDELDREMYHRAVKFLTDNSYKHYEFSNCGRLGFECKHNLKYWSMEDYLGVGLGAASFVGGRRSSNVRSLDRYITSLMAVGLDKPEKQEELRKSEKPYTIPLWVEESYINEHRDSMVEFIITGMRKAEGISLDEFENRFGKAIFEAYPEQANMVKHHIKDGLMEMHGGRLKFTLEGIDISNSVLSEFV